MSAVSDTSLCYDFRLGYVAENLTRPETPSQYLRHLEHRHGSCEEKGVNLLLVRADKRRLWPDSALFAEEEVKAVLELFANGEQLVIRKSNERIVAVVLPDASCARGAAALTRKVG